MEESSLKQVIGRRIREERETRGLTGVALAGQLGITPDRLSRMETGQRGVDTLVLRRVANTFDLPMEAFFEQSGEVVLARRGAGDGEAMGEILDWARRLQRSGHLVDQESRAYG